MEDIFITQIQIKELLHLKDVTIPLDENERKHLILTGKNGSGKTTLLREIKKFVKGIMEEKYSNYLAHSEGINEIKNNINLLEKEHKQPLENALKFYQSSILEFGSCVIEFNNSNFFKEYSKNRNFIFTFFPAQRNNTLNIPTGITKSQFQRHYNLEDTAGNEFIQYLVNLKADRSFARDDNDLETVKNIDTWFENFEKNLFELFDSPNIELKFDRETYNFLVIEEGKPAYNFTQLSDGYSAILNILSELIMRMQAQNPSSSLKNYDIQGVVLIDEIETHLHIDLQKKILPFFTSFFPKIQFIVTTHSPFVISSIEDAVIFDLEKNIIARDLSGYSYDTIIESYFESDKYSNFLKAKIVEYENLLEKDTLTGIELEELMEIKKYLKVIPQFISDELAVKIYQLRTKELDKKY